VNHNLSYAIAGESRRIRAISKVFSISSLNISIRETSRICDAAHHEVSQMTTIQESPVSAKLLFKPDEARTALGISARKLWGLTASGDIPHIRIGRCVRYPVDDLRAWIEEQKHPRQTSAR